MKNFVLLIGLLLTGCSSTSLTMTKAKCNPQTFSAVSTEQDIRTACGDPDIINVTDVISTKRKQWVWRGDNGVYIYTENGHFSSAQWSER